MTRELDPAFDWIEPDAGLHPSWTKSPGGGRVATNERAVLFEHRLQVSGAGDETESKY